MENCLKTQLEESVNNENLSILNILTFNVNEVVDDSRLNNDSVKLIIVNGGARISVRNPQSDYFALSYADLSDPSHRLTTYDIAAGSSNTILYFKNGNYKVDLTKKYDITKFSATTGTSTKDSAISMNLEDFEYCNIEELSFNYNKNITGNVSSIKTNTLKVIAIYGTNSTSALSDCAKFTSLTTLQLNKIVNKQEQNIIDFVNSQIANGRASCEGIATFKAYEWAVFGSNTLASKNSGTISWTSASHITFISGDYVYEKGATAEEITAWKNGGKTVYNENGVQQ